jgi:hypothetical protein
VPDSQLPQVALPQQSPPTTTIVWMPTGVEKSSYVVQTIGGESCTRVNELVQICTGE